MGWAAWLSVVPTLALVACAATPSSNGDLAVPPTADRERDDPATLEPALPAPGTPVPRSDDFAEIKDLQRVIGGDRERLQNGSLRAPELQGSGAERGTFDLDITGRPPVVVIGLPHVTDEAVTWFRERYSTDRLSFRQGVAMPE